jgi:hypothetical protein
MVEEMASEKRREARMYASLKEEFGRGKEKQTKELDLSLLPTKACRRE